MSASTITCPPNSFSAAAAILDLLILADSIILGKLTGGDGVGVELLMDSGLPSGDYVGLFDRRFEREALFNCLREVANDQPATLVSADGQFSIDRATIDEHGAATLFAGQQGAIFALAGAFSDKAELRLATLEPLLAGGEFSAEREAQWREVLSAGPLDEMLLLALENTADGTPEANYRAMAQAASEGTTLDTLVPDEPAHYTGLLGIAPLPPSLGAYRETWSATLATLDPNRLTRAIKLTAPFSALRGGLIGAASAELPHDAALELTRSLAQAPDPFTMLAAFEIIALRHDDSDFAALGDSLLPELLEPEHPRLATGSAFFAAALVLSKGMLAYKHTLADWPCYARRLATFVHASHLARLFAPVMDQADFVARAGQQVLPNAQLSDLCDARELPHHLAMPFAERHVAALSLVASPARSSLMPRISTSCRIWARPSTAWCCATSRPA